MDNKQIQSERMRGYFIDAAKELLKGEGLKSVSTRSVAEKAGYSYATLYNYFRDINDLVFECVRDFQSECEAFVKAGSRKAAPGREKIRAITSAYIDYFIEYPGTFELCFLERIRGIADRKELTELIYTFLDRLCEEQWNILTREDAIDQARVEQMRRQLRFAVMGLLLFYENRGQPGNYDDFITLANGVIGEIVV
ncbi:MAG: TetR/AcrR family transcriptional regulator [Bacteroidota bacterium]